MNDNDKNRLNERDYDEVFYRRGRFLNAAIAVLSILLVVVLASFLVLTLLLNSEQPPVGPSDSESSALTGEATVNTGGDITGSGDESSSSGDTTAEGATSSTLTDPDSGSSITAVGTLSTLDIEVGTPKIEGKIAKVTYEIVLIRADGSLYTGAARLMLKLPNVMASATKDELEVAVVGADCRIISVDGATLTLETDRVGSISVTYTSDSDLIACLPVTPDDVAVPSGLDSKYSILVDLETGLAVAQTRADQQMKIASMTKIMTMIVAFENIKDLNAKAEGTKAIADYVYQEGGASISIKAGEKIPIIDLLYATMLPSACDAPMVIANYVAGSQEEFVRMMNEKALELGMKNTTFYNTTGLEKDGESPNVSTARDVAAMLTYAFRNPFLRNIMSTETYTIAPTDMTGTRYIAHTVFKNINQHKSELTKYTGFEFLGAKSGTETMAKSCLASFARTDSGKYYVCITGFVDGAMHAITDHYYLYSKFAK